MRRLAQLFLHRLKLRKVLAKGRVRLDTRSHGFVSGNDGRVSACCDASASLDSGTPVGYLGGGLTF